MCCTFYTPGDIKVSIDVFQMFAFTDISDNESQIAALHNLHKGVLCS